MSDLTSLNIAVLTVSDTRNETNDTSGATLIKRVFNAGHFFAEKKILCLTISIIFVQSYRHGL